MPLTTTSGFPKQIFNDIPTGHANSPEATRARNQAVLDYVKAVK